MRHQITKVGLIAAIALFAVVGVTLATTSMANAQAAPPHRHHCHEPLPNGNPFPGKRPAGCPPGLEK
jgi:hypothetical protein